MAGVEREPQPPPTVLERNPRRPAGLSLLGAESNAASTGAARRLVGRRVSWKQAVSDRFARHFHPIEQPLSISESTAERYTLADPDVRLMLQVRR